MFTGIIEELGKVLAIKNDKITVSAQIILEGTQIGDSVAVNGVCLTVTGVNANEFNADVSPETMSVTALGFLTTGSLVNLERALPADGRFGGHIVSGHIDGKGVFQSVKKDGSFYNLFCEIPPELTKYVVKKGSIAINGISLTIANIDNNRIKLAVIPHTFENTNLKTLQSGDYINIETDILAKYIEKFLSTSDNKTRISLEFLQENGF